MNALILSASGIAVASIVYGINPEAAFPVMISLSMFGAMLTWGMIFVTHYFFRRQIEKEGRVLSFRVPGFPVGTILGAVLMLAIMLTTYLTDVFKSTLLFGVPFTIALVGLYYVLRRKPQEPETVTQTEQEQV